MKKKLTIIHQSGDKYPPLSLILRWIICFSIYHTSWITSHLKSNFVCDNVPTKAILISFGCLEVNSTFANHLRASQSACTKSTIDLCVIYYSNNCYWPPKLKKFCTAYQSIGHCLHAHIEIHEVLVVASRVINTHLRLYAKQKAVAITYREIKNTDKVVN